MKSSSLCVIPARGGSKSIRFKNLSKVGDLSLLARTIIQAQDSNVFDYIHVSTDSDLIKEEALKFGAKCEFLRPIKYANDNIGTSSCVLHSLEELERDGSFFDYVYELQPTYLFRTSKLIKSISDKINQSKSICTVRKVESTAHPDYICTALGNKEISFGKFLPDQFTRQNLSEYYAVVGVVLASSVKVFKKSKSFFTKNSYAYLIEDNIELFDINSKEDLMIANGIYKVLQN